MKRIVVCGALLLAIMALQVSHASAMRTGPSRYYGFLCGTTNAPAPVCRALKEPHVTRVNDAMVFVVDDDRFHPDGDVFRYGQYWFIYQRGYWYRARSHRGPYSAIEVRNVPRAIIGVPRKFWRHHPLDETQEKRTTVRVPGTRPSGLDRNPRAHVQYRREKHHDRRKLVAMDFDRPSRGHGRDPEHVR